MLRAAVFLLCFLTPALPIRAQEFSVNAYSEFLSRNANLSAAELLAMYDAGTFEAHIFKSGRFNGALYSDSIDLQYKITQYERELIDRNGFMVTERVKPESFGAAFHEIYTTHLPVFISTDAILHAIHMSYDEILMHTEQAVLIPKLTELLQKLHGGLPALAMEYGSTETMTNALGDVDVYLTVPRRLLTDGNVPSKFAQSGEVVDEMLAFIAAEGYAEYPLFADECDRQLDFSQFTPRGHYTQEPDLTRYFRAMIWLGRTELYLIAPTAAGCQIPESDIQRQAMASALITELVDRTGSTSLLTEIDGLIEMFVGESDNVTKPQLDEVLEAAGIENAGGLSDLESLRRFQDELATRPFAGQKILSQILMRNPMSPDQIEPASAFMLLGQRFVIDSYVTGQVVFDRVNRYPLRMLPSTQDVLFALGNDASAQLLEAELEKFGYGPNLAAVRYLIDSYDDSFWDLTLYNGWLNAVRTLNPPSDRSTLPPFMQTAAWWQEKMNTQLASWAQLRHDNLLYVKQSYTGVPICEFPYSYVEPIPAFYEAVSRFATNAANRFRELDSGGWETGRIIDYFRNLSEVSETLEGIAVAELEGSTLTESQQSFLKRMVQLEAGCVITMNGWYVNLYYDPIKAEKPDMVVADVHTSPADEGGSIVGWVLHAGTGPLNLAVVTAEVPGVGPVSFAGPVLSYYEHVSTNFKRLTDEEWVTVYDQEPSFRPEFVNLYLADEEGSSRGPAKWNLTTTVGVEPPETPDAELRLSQNYPNPFRESTLVTFTIPASAEFRPVEVGVFNLQGQRVRSLLSTALPSGSYSLRWDGTLDTGDPAASGTYLLVIRAGERKMSQRMTLVR